MNGIGTGRTARAALLLLALAAAYAIVRYHVFAGVPWARLPLYTLNKAVALSAAALFAAAFIRGRAALPGAGPAALWLTVLHVLMSLALLGPVHFPKLYSEGAPNLTGALAVLAGCLALGAAMVPALANGKALRRLARYAVPAVTAVHAGAIGFSGWLAPREWPGYMPPITLLSCLLLAAPLAARLLRTHE